MSLSPAAPEEEARHAGAYRYIANCANELEALVLQESDEDEDDLGDDDDGHDRGLGQGGGGGHERYDPYGQQQQHPLAPGGAYHHQHHGNNSSNGFARSSTRLRGKDK